MYLKINNKILSFFDKNNIVNIKQILNNKEVFLFEIIDNNKTKMLGLNEFEKIFKKYQKLIDNVYEGNFNYSDLLENEEIRKIFRNFLKDKINENLEIDNSTKIILDLKKKNNKLLIDVDVLSNVNAEKLLEIYENIRNFLFLKKLTNKQKKEILKELSNSNELKNIKETKTGFLIIDPLDKIKFYKLYKKLYGKKYAEKKKENLEKKLKNNTDKKINLNSTNEEIIFDFNDKNEKIDNNNEIIFEFEDEKLEKEKFFTFD